MATSRTPVKLPPSTWVDLYDATGITVGTQLIVQNTGPYPVKLSEATSVPTPDVGFNILNRTDFLTTITSPVGSWAFSRQGSQVQVEEA